MWNKPIVSNIMIGALTLSFEPAEGVEGGEVGELVGEMSVT
jgi:hypothetical protein